MTFNRTMFILLYNNKSNIDKPKPNEAMSTFNTNKYFTEKEIKEFKAESFNYPFLIVEKEQNQVIQITEVISLSGMEENDGTPTEISMQVHTKGKEGNEMKSLRYKLVGSLEQHTRKGNMYA